MPPLLQIQDLRITFTTAGKTLTPVRGVDLEINPGERFALVGESGCGKSLTALSLTRLPPTDKALCSGQIRFDGREILHDSNARRALRKGGIAYVFQDPIASLNPVLRVGDQIAEVAPRSEIPNVLRAVGLPDVERIARSYPCQMSGGQCQRVMLAMALAGNPRLLVADEPTTALDVTIQKQVLELICALSEERRMAVLLITHNLGVVASSMQRMAVMYAGQVVETGLVRETLRAPRHPYTRGLLAAVPTLSDAPGRRLRDIPGEVPSPEAYPQGCGFWPRCPEADSGCREAEPVFTGGVRCCRA